jgi:hypothetical protein
MIDSIIATDPEIKAMKHKIDLSYVSKERARQLAEKQIRTLESKKEESLREAEMIAAAQR